MVRQRIIAVCLLVTIGGIWREFYLLLTNKSNRQFVQLISMDYVTSRGCSKKNLHSLRSSISMKKQGQYWNVNGKSIL